MKLSIILTKNWKQKGAHSLKEVRKSFTTVQSTLSHWLITELCSHDSPWPAPNCNTLAFSPEIGNKTAISSHSVQNISILYSSRDFESEIWINTCCKCKLKSYPVTMRIRDTPTCFTYTRPRLGLCSWCERSVRPSSSPTTSWCRHCHWWM